jgi:uncharacterized membrane protein YdjX (TVP38/TMEM64 family)
MPWRMSLGATGIGILPLTILINVLGERMLTTPFWVWLALGAITAAAWLLWQVCRPHACRAQQRD